VRLALVLMVVQASQTSPGLGPKVSRATPDNEVLQSDNGAVGRPAPNKKFVAERFRAREEPARGG
jgi:hypothetical protein